MRVRFFPVIFVAMVTLSVFSVFSPVFAERISDIFFAREMPSLGIYQQEFFVSSVNVDPELTRGYDELVNFRFEEAVELLKKVVADSEKKPEVRSEAYTFMGYAYLNLRQLEDAVDALEMAVKINPENALAYFFIANIYFLENDFTNTKEYLHKAVKYRPKFVAALRMLGETYKDEHNLKGAAVYYKRILSILPRSGYYNYQYYKIVRMLEDYDEIEKTLQTMIELEPKFYINRIMLGDVYTSVGRYDDAMTQYDFVISKDPRIARAYEGRARVFLAREMFDKALEEAVSLQQRDPKNAYVESLIIEIKARKLAKHRNFYLNIIKGASAVLLVVLVFYFFIMHRSKQYIVREIKTFNKAVDNTYEIDDLMAFILRFFINTVNAEKGAFLLFNRQNNQLSIKKIEGIEDEEMMNFSLFAGEEMTNWLSNLKKTFLTMEDVKKDKLFDEVFPSLKERLNAMKMKYIIPLRERNSFVGLIAFDIFKPERHAIHYEEDLFSPLSILSSQALSTFTLYETTISDETTGLFNKRYFIQNLSIELKRADRYDQPLSLLTFDIDNFKKVNDTYGHPQGDRVLKELGAIVIATFREGIDISSRTGGEEFSVLLPATDTERAKIAAERLRSAVEKREFPGFPENDNHVTVSIGLSTYPLHTSSGRELIEKSDEALYLAKKTGKNRVCVVEQLEETGFRMGKEIRKKDKEPEKTVVSPVLLDSTGLYSRGFFDERYAGEVHRAERHGRPCSLLMIQLDNKVDDARVTEMVANFAEALKNNLRKGIDVPARYNNDILAVLLPETDFHKGIMIARRVKKLLDSDSSKFLGEKMTFSVGVSNYPSMGKTEESIVESAKQALRMCQNMGGDRAILASHL